MDDNLTSGPVNTPVGGRLEMPRQSPLQKRLNGYVEHMDKIARYAERTIEGYKSAIIRCHDIVREGNGPENPEKVTEEDLRYLLDHQTGCTAYRKYDWTAYVGFLKWLRNPAIVEVKPRWPPVGRTHVDWLEPEDAETVRNTAFEMGPLHGLIVHLELDLLLRRVEVMRLKVHDVHRDYIDVLGKGPRGGKPRTLSLAPDSQEVIGRYLALRRQLESMTEGPQTDALVVYQRDRTLWPYGETALDNVLKQVQEESGVRFLGHHTLRRTGGRIMWLVSVPVETISSIYGHASTEMTLRYIGVNLSDQARAHEAVARQRIQMQKTAKMVPFQVMPGV